MTTNPGTMTPATYTGVIGKGVASQFKITDSTGNVIDLEPIYQTLLDIKSLLTEIRNNLED